MNWEDRLKEERVQPSLRADSDQAVLAATSDELVYLDARRAQRIALAKISKINIDAQGLLRIQTGGQEALSVSVQGFQAQDLKQFFEGLKPMVTEAKQKPAVAPQKPARTPKPPRPAPTPAVKPAVKAQPALAAEPGEDAEPLPIHQQSETRSLIGRFKLLSLLIVLVGAVFGGLQYTDNPRELIAAAWMFVSSIFLALVVLVLSEVLRVLIDRQERSL